MGTDFARQGVSSAYAGMIDSRKAIDGNPRRCTYTYYNIGDDFHWWRVYFNKIILVREVIIANSKSRIHGKYSVHHLLCSH